MRKARLDEMIGGWFVGAFQPTVLHTTDVEVSVKHYRAGDRSELHHHKIATEITLIASGEVEMNGERFITGDIVVIEPNEAADFRAIADTVTVVVKHPGAPHDKFPGGVKATLARDE